MDHKLKVNFAQNLIQIKNFKILKLKSNVVYITDKWNTNNHLILNKLKDQRKNPLTIRKYNLKIMILYLI